ncbi:GNAT family N-acetyltransferase [Cellulophaga sp. Z1A5H]|uniref:GNAT family N-acetyltransferase n=1 Tax=Cellulophaga sp. Z1A5H TaxID=2687291 RepID=UPI0013FD8FD4|nr:GNAT family N-acetyltransferase [Cellulophaga sp. Z1A5H]
MIFSRTDATNKDFIALTKELDAYLKTTDDDEHDFYHQFNGIESLNTVIIAYHNEIPIGCGAIKHYNDSTLEIKRMYVTPNSRGKGVASKILKELEQWSRDLKYTTCILETGTRQLEAIALYHKNFYKQISNYGPYNEAENSLCFKKTI